jgi:hypothetical protein
MELLVNDWSGRLVNDLPVTAGAGDAFAVSPAAPASAVGGSARARVGTEIVVVTITSGDTWTIVAREAEDADRYPKRLWAAGTAVDLVLTAGGLTSLISAGVQTTLTGENVAKTSVTNTFTESQVFKGAVAVQDASGHSRGGFDSNQYLYLPGDNNTGIQWRKADGSWLGTSITQFSGISIDFNTGSSAALQISTALGNDQVRLYGRNGRHLTLMLDGANLTKSVQVQQQTGQTGDTFQVRNSTGGTDFAVAPGGKIKTNQTAAATALGTVVGKQPLYDAAGTLVGYVPVYDAIT